MNSREKIILVSAELFHKYGYNSVGLSKILKEANIPKGSFYHYFENKETLLQEVIQHFVNETIAIFQRYPDTIQGLHDFFNAYFDRFESLNFTRGCPIGNFALELSDVNNNARMQFLEWTIYLDENIKQVLVKEKIVLQEATKLSSFIVAAFEGALLKAKIEKSRKSLEEFNYYIFNKLLKNTEM